MTVEAKQRADWTASSGWLLQASETCKNRDVACTGGKRTTLAALRERLPSTTPDDSIAPTVPRTAA